MAPGDLSDEVRLKRLEAVVFGDKTIGSEGLVDVVNRHQRQIYGIAAEGWRGLLTRADAIETAFNTLAKRVDDMSDGKKTLLTLIGFGVSSLTGLAALAATAITLLVVLRGGTP